eukprot:6783557-Prymnesium_polylepis.2
MARGWAAGAWSPWCWWVLGLVALLSARALHASQRAGRVAARKGIACESTSLSHQNWLSALLRLGKAAKVFATKRQWQYVYRLDSPGACPGPTRRALSCESFILPSVTTHPNA